MDGTDCLGIAVGVKKNITNSCWICGKHADSREHRLKKTDIEPLFKPNEPVYLNSPTHKNTKIQGPNSSIFKFEKSICKNCNGSLTQPYDLAWQALSTKLKERISQNQTQASFSVNDCFERKHQMRRLRQCHLYFVKWLGCQLVDAQSNFDREGFAKSLKTGTAYQDLYLKFGNSFWENEGVGQSDLYARLKNDNLVHAVQIYDAGNGLSVLVVYAKSTAPVINALEGVWHPRMGTDIEFSCGELIGT